MDKLDQKVTLLKLIVEDLEFEFSNCFMDHPNSSRLKDIKAKYNGIIQNTDLINFGYAIKDNIIHHESEYGNVFSEMDNSLNFNDMSGNYNVGECNHGVEELDNDFINETNEENGEDSSEEEMIEELEPGTFTSLLKFPAIKQLAIKRWDEYGFVIHPGLVGATCKSVRIDL
nr:hypothetical protein [Tanacetum cinerariifolium]